MLSSIKYGVIVKVFKMEFFAAWENKVIGEKIIADAILDYITHDSHCMELKGESMRIKHGIQTKECRLKITYK